MRKRPLDPRIGKRIAVLRTASQLTQEQVAELVGISRPTITNYETGKIAVPIMMLDKLARALKCKPIDFLRPPDAPLPIYVRRRKFNSVKKTPR